VVLEKKHMKNVDAALTAKNLNVYYGDFLAIKDVNMAMKRNSVTALIGPSGCGKSTFLRCLNRMNDLITSASVRGEILFENLNIYSDIVDATEIRSKIGMVFQKPNPFPKSIYQNIVFGLKVNGFSGDIDEAVERSLHQASLWEEVKDRLDDSAFTLSGGQQQRVAIARALVSDTDILVCDEPTGDLDRGTATEILQLLQILNRDHGKTILMVTHDPMAAESAKRTLQLDKGKLTY